MPKHPADCPIWEQVEGDQDIRMAGIGGLSALLGWTEVQQQTSKGFLGGGSNIIKGVRLLMPPPPPFAN